MRQVVVMVTSSYPRYPGDGVGSFMEPIAKGVAARGHEVHVVAPWHPAIVRGKHEDGVFFHFYHYAMTPSLNVFGYAGGLREDTTLRFRTWLAAPAALAMGWFKALRVAQKRRATVMHGHWVVPGGITASLAGGGRPLVVSLHGSDVYVAEHHAAARFAARRAFANAGWVTACSDDLRNRAVALGARPELAETLAYGVDPNRFKPDPGARERHRAELGAVNGPLVFSAGRLVRKKGFEHLIDAAALLRADFPNLRVAIAGGGDLADELAARAARLPETVRLLGVRSQDDIAHLAAAADVVAVPSVRDDAGNVDGLPNFALEATATATPVVASRVAGLPLLIEDGRTGLLVPERDPRALADALRVLITNPERARQLGEAGRDKVRREFSWTAYSERLEQAYAAAASRSGQ